jgi:hypothetical protein
VPEVSEVPDVPNGIEVTGFYPILLSGAIKVQEVGQAFVPQKRKEERMGDGCFLIEDF